MSRILFDFFTIPHFTEFIALKIFWFKIGPLSGFSIHLAGLGLVLVAKIVSSPTLQLRRDKKIVHTA